MQDNRIKVTNTAIIIDNYELHESEQLEHPFQIYDPVYHRMNYLGFYYDKENKRSVFVSERDVPDEYKILMNDKGDSLDRVVCDYVSSMTDKYAIAHFQKLFMPDSWKDLV